VREKIIKILRQHSNQHVSGEKLSEKLEVSRTAIWKNINILKEEGYKIESVPRKGYILRGTPDLLSEIEIQSGLQTKIIGKEIIHFDSITSTNDTAKEFALKRAKEGLVITAEEQLKGRGRRGRTWESPKGTGIWMTILLRPDISPSQGPKFTLLSAVAVAKSIKEVTGLNAKIKWPNDIIINNKKVCGILTEMNAEIDFVNHIIIGIGVNVNAMQDDFPIEVQQRAISLAQETGKKVSRQELARKILENIEKRYLAFIQGMDFENILEEWKGLSCNLGKQVKATVNGKELIGTAVDINKDGALILKTDEEKFIEINYGDVMVRGIDNYV
jgi:BirA family biotin operon repressor/biotin-[acetyl-CoA-carboxylase] ligase